MQPEATVLAEKREDVMMRQLHFWFAISSLCAAALPRVAAAQTSTISSANATLSAMPSVPPSEEQQSEAAASSSESQKDVGAVRHHAEERPFSFLQDPTTPSAGDVSLEYALGYASGTEADRPLPSTVAPTGAQHALTFAYGVTSRIAPLLSVRVLQPTVGNDPLRATGNIGARFQLTDPDSMHFRLSVATVAFREFAGDLGAYARVMGSYDFGKLRAAANVHLEHVFANGRDALDVLALAGVSYRLIDRLRVGVEYVGQDLEGMVDDDEAEGGAHHYVGPSVAVDLLAERLQFTAGLAAGLGDQAQPVVGRIAALMTF
jgi:hypothetical protein